MDKNGWIVGLNMAQKVYFQPNFSIKPPILVKF